VQDVPKIKPTQTRSAKSERNRERIGGKILTYPADSRLFCGCEPSSG
jgi:hypothetical protein